MERASSLVGHLSPTRHDVSSLAACRPFSGPALVSESPSPSTPSSSRSCCSSDAAAMPALWLGSFRTVSCSFAALLHDSRVPRRRKALLVALVGYLAMPFDLIPDFIPVAGQLDDVILVAVVLRLLLRANGADLVREHWPGPRSSLQLVLRLAYGDARS
jgi:uncharacterized membrane protein YkvA (DUF1232 family)